jgi:hypothetical protein
MLRSFTRARTVPGAGLVGSPKIAVRMGVNRPESSGIPPTAEVTRLVTDPTIPLTQVNRAVDCMVGTIRSSLQIGEVVFGGVPKAFMRDAELLSRLSCP